MMLCSMLVMLCLDCMPAVCTCITGPQLCTFLKRSCSLLVLSIVLLSWAHAQYRAFCPSNLQLIRCLTVQ